MYMVFVVLCWVFAIPMIVFSIRKSKKKQQEKEQQAIRDGKYDEHIMRCNVCGHIFTYTQAAIEEKAAELKRAKSLRLRSRMMGLGNGSELSHAEASFNSSKAQLDSMKKCPSCHSANVTEISADEAASARNNAAKPTASAADELAKYKQLLDTGIITQEEFDAKKKQLLGL